LCGVAAARSTPSVLRRGDAPRCSTSTVMGVLGTAAPHGPSRALCCCGVCFAGERSAGEGERSRADRNWTLLAAACCAADAGERCWRSLASPPRSASSGFTAMSEMRGEKGFDGSAVCGAGREVMVKSCRRAAASVPSVAVGRVRGASGDVRRLRQGFLEQGEGGRWYAPQGRARGREVLRR
jgi:hypothetical protein